MSNIYVQEPPTEGKVLLETSVGDIEIELWSREAPKACRNFVQLCLENYYNKTKFHRVVREFIVQGGDPTGTGRGGESVYGHPFKDEFHSRLRFCRRGLVAMANSGKDDNGSQFFFTLGPTQELQNKHTIFGKVAGDTVYNMLKLQDGVVDEDDRPKYPNKVLRTKVIKNPFDDLVPRNLIEMIKDDQEDKKPKSKMKATKDYKLLSFGDEAEEEEDELDAASEQLGKVEGGKSAHDLLKDDKLSAEVGMEPAAKRRREESDSDPGEVEEASVQQEDVDIGSIKDKLSKKKKKTKEPKDFIESVADEELDFEPDEEEDEKSIEKRKQLEIQKEIKALKRELKGGGKGQKTKGDAKDEEEVEEGDKLTEEERANDMLRSFHEEQSKFASKKTSVPKKGSKREDMTLQLLSKFKQKMHTVKSVEDEAEEKEPKKALDDADEEEEDADLAGDGWMKNKLKFASNDPVLARDANKKGDDAFAIFDPRNPLNKRRREADAKKKGQRW